MRDVADYGPAPACADAELSLLLSQLDQATGEWLSELGDDVTDDELRWQPFAGGHSVAALIAHIAGVEAFWLHQVAAGEPPRDLEEEVIPGGIDQYALQWGTPPAGRPLAFYKDLLRTTRERTRELVAALEDPRRTFPRTRRDGTTVEYTLRWLLTHVILHEAYHGGQAVLLLLEQRRRAR